MEDLDDYKSDVILRVDGEEFCCCREDLAKYSPYFEAMFNHNFVEKSKRVIDLKGIEPEAMSILLRFATNNEVSTEILNSGVILSVLQASSMLQFENLKKVCIRLIAKEWLTVETCLQTAKTAYELDIVELYNKARSLALWEFSEVKLTPAFNDLSIDALEEYLSDDGLNVTQGEFEVFEAGVNWLQEKTERSCYASRVLMCVRFTELSISDIKTMYLYPQIAMCNDLLKCILQWREQHSVSRLSVTDIHREDTEKISDSEVGTKININSHHSKIRKSTVSCLQNAKTCSICQNFCFCLPENIVDKIESKFDENVGDETSSLVCPKTGHELPQVNSGKLKTEIRNTDIILQSLHMPRRKLPLVPCVVGHKLIQQDKSSVKRTYVMYFEEKKLKRPIPFLHLSKVNESVYEPIGYQVVNRGKELFVIGGEYLMGYGNWNNSVWKYDLIKEDWTFETSLPAPRRHHAVCCVNDDIYVIGGFGRHRVIMASVIKYSITTRKWIHCSSLPQNMYSVACCSYKSYIFVFGLEVYIYHIESDMWHTFKEPPITNNMAFNSAMTYEDSIYLTGSYSPELIKFSPHISSSQTDADHKTVGCFNYQPAGACLVHNRIYSFSSDEEGHMFIEMYDIERGTFELVWEGAENEIDGITDFNAKSHVGCFAMCLY